MLVAIISLSTAFSCVLGYGYTFESSNYPGYYVRHRGYKLYIDRDDNSQLFKDDSSFKVVAALNGKSDYVSFESTNYPDHYIRHAGYRLSIAYYQNTNLFKEDASWKRKDALNGKTNYYSFESSNYPGHYFRHRSYEIWLDQYQNSNLYKEDASFTFNPVLGGCTHWKDFQWLGTNPLFPSEATLITIDYNNNGPIEQQAGNVGAEECEEATFEMTQETNWEVGITVGTEVSVFGSGVSVEVSASFGGSNSETSGTVDSECLSWDFATATCPARYTCQRTITVSEVKNQEKEFTATIVCGGVELPYKGKMKINGGFDVDYQDESFPMSCAGVLPHCDQCSTANANLCDSCDSGYYLIHYGNNQRQCINYYGCVYDCGGTADESTNSEGQCSNPQSVNSAACQSRLAGNVMSIPISETTLMVIGILVAILFVCNMVLVIKNCCWRKKEKGYSAVKYMDSDSEIEATKLNV